MTTLQERLAEAAAGIIAMLLILAMFAFVGTIEYQDDQREIAYWESQGVTITRW